MNNLKPDIINYPYVERCYNYIVYDGMSCIEAAEAYADDFPVEPSEEDIINLAKDIENDFKQYINDGGTLNNHCHLSLH